MVIKITLIDAPRQVAESLETTIEVPVTRDAFVAVIRNFDDLMWRKVTGWKLNDRRSGLDRRQSRRSTELF